MSGSPSGRSIFGSTPASTGRPRNSSTPARVAGILPPLDGVTAALDDPDRLAEDVDHARRLGFGGKVCIHPEQIEAVNRGFVPSEAEALWARRVLEAAGMVAVRFEGEMIDRPVIERARRILARVTRQG